jgi:hypothetical protein
MPESTNQQREDLSSHGGGDIGNSIPIKNDQILGDLLPTPIESSIETPKQDDY